jgi:hypothetical protein
MSLRFVLPLKWRVPPFGQSLVDLEKFVFIMSLTADAAQPQQHSVGTAKTREYFCREMPRVLL